MNTTNAPQANGGNPQTQADTTTDKTKDVNQLALAKRNHRATVAGIIIASCIGLFGAIVTLLAYLAQSKEIKPTGAEKKSDSGIIIYTLNYTSPNSNPGIQRPVADIPLTDATSTEHETSTESSSGAVTATNDAVSSTYTQPSIKSGYLYLGSYDSEGQEWIGAAISENVLNKIRQTGSVDGVSQIVTTTDLNVYDTPPSNSISEANMIGSNIVEANTRCSVIGPLSVFSSGNCTKYWIQIQTL